MPLDASIASFRATNSAPNTEVSHVACFLLSQSFGAIFIKMKYPDLDLLVLLSPAKSACESMLTNRWEVHQRRGDESRSYKARSTVGSKFGTN